MELKGIDSKKLMAYGILALILIVVIVFAVSSRKAKESDVTDMNIADQNSTYDSKLAAYKAKEGEKTQTNSYQFNVDEYLKNEENNKEQDIYENEDEEIRRLQQSLRANEKPKPVISQAPTHKPLVKHDDPVQQLEAIVKEKNIPEQVSRASIVETTQKSIITETNQEKAEQNTKKQSRFFRGGNREEKGNSTPAVVQGEQTVSDGSTLLMRTLEDTYTSSGILIPKNTYISGIVRLTEERLNIQIQSVRLEKNIYNISRDVYDLDGLKGLNVPENVKAELARQASARALENTDTRTSGGSIVNKVGNAVGDAAKSVLSKDKREIKVTIKNNYQIFLK
ncbi:MAG: conjugative transposon protein TraM [Dysgonomonas sp.]